jgi:hypothetical protein
MNFHKMYSKLWKVKIGLEKCTPFTKILNFEEPLIMSNIKFFVILNRHKLTVYSASYIQYADCWFIQNQKQKYFATVLFLRTISSFTYTSVFCGFILS